MDFDKYKMQNMDYPTYLQEIFRTNEEITLVYSKVNPNAEDENQDEYIPKEEEEQKSDVTLELTGNPLQVDLKGDDDLCDTSTLATVPDNWTEDESRHYPIDKTAARKLLNTLNNNYSYDLFGTGEKVVSPTVFVVMDPKNDSRHTFLMGSNVPTNKRIISYFKGCYSRSHPDMDPPKMLEKHKRNRDSACNVTSVATAVYSIQGWNLQNSRQNSKLYSSMHLEVTWNGYSYEPILSNVTNKQLKMQIINGHRESPFHHLWQQLVFVRFLMDAYKIGSNLDELVFSSDPMHISEIYNNIKNMMQPGKMMRRKNGEFKDLDLNNRDDEDFMDKLWGLLIRSENITDLKESIIIIFEEFASQSSFTHNKISEYNTTSIGSIIKGICDGTMAVPNITSTQALLYLIELGVQKLKNDYVYIIDHCHKVKCMDVINHWNDISKTAIEEMNKSDNRKTAGNPRLTVASRMTRITMGKNAGNQELTGIIKQVNYLANLHVMSQFIYLALSILPPEINEFLIGSITKKYLNGGSLTLKQLEADGFQEIVLDLYKIWLSYLKTLNVVSWNLNITSKIKESRVTSIFHHSEKPIIPTCIFKDYNVGLEGNKEKMYYVTETVVLSQET